MEDFSDNIPVTVILCLTSHKSFHFHFNDISGELPIFFFFFLINLNESPAFRSI